MGDFFGERCGDEKRRIMMVFASELGDFGEQTRCFTVKGWDLTNKNYSKKSELISNKW